MRLIDNRTGLEVLGRDECLRLLEGQVIGRVAVSDAGQPEIFPVNYVLDGDEIVFRTAPGTKFDSAVRNRPVAFEIDAADATYHAGWSVVVAGHAREVTDEDRLAEIDHLPLRPWAEGEKAHVVAISTERVTGRRIVPVDAGS
ncbi:MAG TPA: pyridoxamine 5'-phosphate oxidase family protein [Acidimicrobiales bacterium]|nr:pyridoxamine 5'-phosphate oxidase family protein [Acidimicrobiales bacterium]